MLKKLGQIIFIFLLSIHACLGATVLECLLKNMVSDIEGAKFLHQRDPKLHKSFKVEAAKSKLRSVMKKLPEDDPNFPGMKIAHWLETLEQLHAKAFKDDQILIKWRDHYHEKYLIREEDIPENYYLNQLRIEREQGRTDFKLTPEFRSERAAIIVGDQRNSLDRWLAYFLSPETKQYPLWAKYWAFEGMLKLGKLDLSTWKFSGRSRSMVAPFAELNPEAIAMVMEVIQRRVEGKAFDTNHDPRLVADSSSGNFGKLYARALNLVRQQSVDLSHVEGHWVKYPRGSSARALTRGLKAKGTGWCSCELTSANSQLREGDFYVYYSKSKNGENTQPRIAIRMEGPDIVEVRGIAQDQNLDIEIGKTDILQKKLNEFGDSAEIYHKKNADTKLINQIEHKHNKGEALTKEEIRFLYELDQKIKGFGLGKHPRIKQIIKQRDKRADLSYALNLRPEEISFTAKQALQGGIKYHVGDLKLESLAPGQKVVLPEYVHGNLKITHAQQLGGNIVMPKVVKGDVDLPHTLSLEAVVFPDLVGGHLKLNKVQTATKVKLPSEVGGSMLMDGISELRGIEQMPLRVGQDFSMNSITHFAHHAMPEVLNGSIRLNSLSSAKGLRLPKVLRGSLELKRLTSADGLKLPNDILGDLDLSGLTSAQYLKLPDFLAGSLNLSALRTATYLRLPKNIIGDLIMNGLESAEGLVLPEAIGGGLALNNLRSAKHLVFSGTVENSIELTGLESLQDLKLPTEFEGILYVSRKTQGLAEFKKSFTGQIRSVRVSK